MDVRYAPHTAHWMMFITVSLNLIDLFILNMLLIIAILMVRLHVCLDPDIILGRESIGMQHKEGCDDLQ